jgi:hypothetical protein
LKSKRQWEKQVEPMTESLIPDSYAQFLADLKGRIPLAMRRDLTRWGQVVDIGKLPALRPPHGLSPGGMEL